MLSIHGDQMEELLRRLIHELRQPLDVIETSAFILDRSLADGSRDREFVRAIERQVGQASLVLAEAADELRRRRAQRAGSLEVTNPATAAVT